MRSFTSILLTLSLPLYALAAHGNARRHTGLAHRTRGDILDKRDFQAQLTLYDIDVGLTACGGAYKPNAFVVALNGDMFGSGYPGPHCGKTIVLTANGKTTTATIVDMCPGCPFGGLDLTRGLFHFFADSGVEEMQGSWHYASDGGDDQSTKLPVPTTTTTHKPKPTPTPTPEHSPSPKHTTTSTHEPSPSPSTTSTSSKEPTTTSTSTTNSTTTSKPHSSTTSSPSPSPTSSLNPDGLALPAGVIPDGQSPQNLESLNEVITNLGTLVEACQGDDE